MSDTTIRSIKAHKVLNSRAQWTVNTTVELSNGISSSQTVPEGASKGLHEAVYLPVDKALEVINGPIAAALVGEDVLDQFEIDRILLQMDGTPNKRVLGGNSILSISIAACECAALYKKVELYEHLGELHHKLRNTKFVKNKLRIPTPLFNVLNGGKHAQNSLSFQEFMIIPAPSMSIHESLELGVNVYNDLKTLLNDARFSTGVGDEGGFAPKGFNARLALDFLRQAASKHYNVGKDVFFGMDAAAESFYDRKLQHYLLPEEQLKLSKYTLADYYDDLLAKYELMYLEDPFFEGDYEGWEYFYGSHAHNLLVVADDLVVTNSIFLKKAIDLGLANAVIVKPNQVGSVMETLEFISMAQNNSLSTIVSHRSGDTAEDTFIADLGVGVGADFIKAGAPVRGERVVKYNRLLDIAESGIGA